MIELHYLSNGLPVVLEPMEWVRSVSIGIYIKVGSAYETTQTNGLSHLIEHMLFKGTKHRSGKEIAIAFGKIGGEVNAYTAKEDTCYYAHILDDHLIEGIELLGDMVCNSTFDPEELRKEIEVILEEIDMYEDSPEDIAIEHLQEISFPHSSLGFDISGKKEVVSNFQREDLIQFMNYWYTANNMVISIAGNFDISIILPILEQNFGNIKRGKQMIEKENAIFVPAYSSIQKEIEQTHISVGFLGSHYYSKNKYIQILLNQCLGEGDDSRLFQKLREDLGLVYSIYSFCEFFHDAGIFQIYSAMNSQKVQIFFKELQSILLELHQVGITENELFCAKEQLRASFLMGLDLCDNRMEQNGKSLLFHGKLQNTEQVIERLLSVTKEEINVHIKECFIPHNMSISIVENRNRSGKDIEKMWKMKYLT